MDIDEQLAAYLARYTEREDEVLRAARARSEEADVPAVPPETGALLRWFARLVKARHVVEVGSGGGYSGLWLLGGMAPRGTLTTIELDPDRQTLAQRAFAEAGYGDRVRSMLGAALTVLPKLADHHYDLMFIDAVKTEYGEYLAHAKRLLRHGGLLLADNVLWSGRVADATVTDDKTEALRGFNEAVHDDPDWHPLLLTVDDGVLAAVLDAQE